jgi:hypothetical protein
VAGGFTLKAPWTRAFPNQVLTRKRERRPVRRISNVMRKLIAKAQELLDAWWQDPANRYCCVPHCVRKAKHRHHVRGRTRLLMNNPRWWAAICEPHHEMVKTNPRWAQNLTIYEGTDREMQLLASGAEWMNSDRD